MTEDGIDGLLSRIRALGTLDHVYHRGHRVDGPLSCTVAPAMPWNGPEMEVVLNLTLPGDLERLWTKTSGLRLFEDIKDGQWGLVLWGPAGALRKSPMEISRRKIDFRSGDLVVGEFLGDADLLVIRCDRGADDFGKAMIALEIDPRDEWPTVGKSTLEFLEKFIDASGDKFWEPL